MRTHRITHSTVYTYSDVVTASYGRAWLRPRELAHQHCTAHELVVDPGAADLSTGADVHGNEMAYFQVTEPHDRLEVRGTSVVEVRAPVVDPAALTRPWEDSRPTAAHDHDARDFLLAPRDLGLRERVRAHAAGSLLPGRPVGDAVTDLVHRIHAEFTYRSGSTTVRTGLDEVLDARTGVCQDFARLAVAGLRAHGLAARYVSGYLATDPPPGRERMVGVDATHAWAAVWLPSGATGPGQWLAFDPTNDQLADERYTTMAWGRDYVDVPPLRGIVFSDAESSTLRVSVDVAPG